MWDTFKVNVVNSVGYKEDTACLKQSLKKVFNNFNKRC